MARILPERRTPVDLAISAAIVVVLVVAGIAVWYVSPVRHTEDARAATAPPDVAPATSVPTGFRVAWRAASAATETPAVARSVIVSADGGTVSGRDPASGRVLWEYRRNLPLCTAAAAWRASTDEILAVYLNSRGCSEVTALDAASGRRLGARTSDADDTLRLITDSGYVVAAGPTRVETWGSNLVRGVEYGRVSAPVKPGVQPGRVDCRIESAAIGGSRIALIEHCRNDPGYRLTVLGAVLDSDEKVQQFGSSVITSGTSGPPPVLVAMSGSAIAVYDGGGNSPEPTPPTIRGFNSDGAPTTTNTVEGGAAPPADSVAQADDGLVTFFTGTATVVLNGQTMRPIYQVPGTAGPGETMAGQLLLPTPAGISVRDPATGRETRSIAVADIDGGDKATGTVSLRVLGDRVVEQRGTTIVTLAPAG